MNYFVIVFNNCSQYKVFNINIQNKYVSFNILYDVELKHLVDELISPNIII